MNGFRRRQAARNQSVSAFMMTSIHCFVMPAEAGIQFVRQILDSRLRENDGGFAAL
jgi:hypothetical protein